MEPLWKTSTGGLADDLRRVGEEEHIKGKKQPRGSHGRWSVASSVAWADYSDIQEFAF